MVLFDATTIEWIIAGVLFFVFFVIAGVGGFLAVYFKKWRFKFEVYERGANGKYFRSRKGRCRLVPFGDGGEEIFFLKGMKKFRPANGERIAKNTVAWFIDPESGYWYCVSFEDLNTKLRKIGIMPIDRDMRMSNSMIRRGIESRYNKQSFMEKYGTIIAFGMLFLCIIGFGGVIWLALDKTNQNSATNLEVSKTSLDVMKQADVVISHLANIKGGVGPGYTNSTG